MTSTITVAAIQAAMALCLVEMEEFLKGGLQEEPNTTRLGLLSVTKLSEDEVEVVLSVSKTVRKLKRVGEKFSERNPLESDTTIKFSMDLIATTEKPWDWNFLRATMWRAVAQAIQSTEVDLRDRAG